MHIYFERRGVGDDLDTCMHACCAWRLEVQRIILDHSCKKYCNMTANIIQQSLVYLILCIIYSQFLCDFEDLIHVVVSVVAIYTE